MDLSKGAGAAVYSEKSETGILEENYSWQIPINHNDFKILKNNESCLCEVLQNKFGCISTLVSPAREGNSESLPVFRKMLTPGLELSVWKDDLTRHAVDAVVNAANEDLLHGGGLAYALVKAGGQEIQEESIMAVSRYGKVPTGEIAITGAGRLPCKLIIHAVGPRWMQMYRDQCIAHLKRAIRNIMDYVTSQDIKTVAIPALSSGIFHFPLDLCTQIIVDTIRSYFERKQLPGVLKEIHLVSNEDPTVAAFKDASELILRPKELGPSVSQGAFFSSTEMVINNLTLQIVQDYIELQKVDVIVNSVSLPPDFGLSPVSKSILQQAGDELEKELTSILRWISQNPQLVLVTKGFKLSCQYIFHVLWFYGYELRLKDAMRKCLEKCLELNLTSISFPAFAGTGFTGLGKEKPADIMLDQVLMFARHHSSKQLTVRFVIFPDQQETFKVFLTELNKRKANLQPLNNHSVPQGTRDNQENGLKGKSPAINLMGCNQEKMHEAQEWIRRLLTHQDKHTIENNHILYLGKKEHDSLSQLQEISKVSISETVSLEKAILEIKGDQADCIEAIMNIEQMLYEVQEEMARKKEQALWSLSGQWTDQQRKHHDEMKENRFLKRLMLSTQEVLHQKKEFENCGLQVIKVEKIDNVLLMDAFQKKKKMMEERMSGKPVSQRLFQQIPQQFCEAVCRVGFQRAYSVPCDPKYGAGIYFTKNLKSLAYQVMNTAATDKPIYVFEAEVLTGSCCQSHGLNIVPLPLSPGAIDRYDSVVDNVSCPETFVIFNSVQAMPQYLWTCTRNPGWPQNYSSGSMMLSSQWNWH